MSARSFPTRLSAAIVVSGLGAVLGGGSAAAQPGPEPPPSEPPPERPPEIARELDPEPPPDPPASDPAPPAAPPSPAPPPEAAPPPTPPPPPGASPPTAPTAAAQPQSQRPGVWQRAARVEPGPPVPLHVPPSDTPETRAWYDRFELAAFVDAYAAIDYNFPKPQSGRNAAWRAYDASNGFALSWVGLDVGYPAAPVGGQLSLRFGPTSETIAGSCLAGTTSDGSRTAPCDSQLGLAPIKQAYATWRPFEDLELDFGKFDTIYGAEVAESQDNFNYTRGALYWLAQPLFHTGLRASLAFGPEVAATVLAVNGWNNTADNNAGKTFGAQLVYIPKIAQPNARVRGSVGYLVGPERDDIASVVCPAGTAFDPRVGCAPAPGSPETEFLADQGENNTRGLRHLIDLTFEYDPVKDVELVFNADLGLERVRAAGQSDFDLVSWWGVMAAGRYRISRVFAAAIRGEYFRDEDGNQTGTSADPRTADFEALVTGTLTLEAAPSDHLVIRLDNRYDRAVPQEFVFRKAIRDGSDTMITTTLGVVATTD